MDYLWTYIAKEGENAYEMETSLTIPYIHRKGWQLLLGIQHFNMQSHAVDNGCGPKLTPVQRT